jgi:hypothetical protein
MSADVFLEKKLDLGNGDVPTLRRYGIVVDAVGVEGVPRQEDKSDMDLRASSGRRHKGT